MSDIGFYAAKPGDICNDAGDIRGVDGWGSAQIVQTGEVAVTMRQALAAKPYGWDRISAKTERNDDLVIVRRDWRAPT